MDSQESRVPAPWSRAPRIRSLSSIQSQYILTRNCTGRMAFIARGRPELLPLHYVYRDGRIYARTSFGVKCEGWSDNATVTFGVEESEGLFDWRSVLVRGSLCMLSPHGTADERSAYWHAVAAIRSLVPVTLTERDPVPERRVILMIEPAEISGREASTRYGNKDL